MTPGLCLIRRLVAFFLLGWACAAYADSPSQTLEEAKRVAKQASIQYQLGNFAEAADAYARSYALVQTPGLLFNLGQAQMMLKRYERAVFFFEGYLRDKPDAPNAPLVRDLIAEARREIVGAKEREAAAEVARQEAILRAQPPPPSLPPAPPPTPRRTVRLRWAAVGTGAGAALIGAGLALGLRADLARGLAELTPAGGAERAQLDRDHRTYLIAASVVGGVGGVAAITSGVLAYLGWGRRPTVVVAPSSGGAQLSFSGSF